MKKLNGHTYLLETNLLNEFSFFGYIFIKKTTPEHIRLHEEGHRLQWFKYGGFKYFFKVAIPSFVCCIIDKVILKHLWSREKRNAWYYSHSWEREATELGCKMNGKPID